MRRIIKIILTFLGIAGLLLLWLWADSADYFNTNYRDLSEEQQNIFKWKDDDDFDIYKVYRQNMFDTTYSFPRQKTEKIKLYKNIPLIGVFTAKTLKSNKNTAFVNFCNDSTNFSWGETTWGYYEAEYYIKLYNSENVTVGKIYICMKDCGMTSARPFCPAMKFGGLSGKGIKWLNELINNNNNWK
jgi:hypothetical protein